MAENGTAHHHGDMDEQCPPTQRDLRGDIQRLERSQQTLLAELANIHDTVHANAAAVNRTHAELTIQRGLLHDIKEQLERLDARLQGEARGS
jgi:predicted  nucleic acid-binding Zn-ribbon protein